MKSDPQPNTTATQTPPRRTLVSVALGLSILSPVPCCPMVGFLSTALSFIALWKLRESLDQRSRRLARVALVLSLAGLVAQALTYEAMSEGVMRDLSRNMNSSMRAAFENDYSKCVISGTPNPISPVERSAPSAEQVRVFSSLAKERYGELRDISVISQVGGGGMFDVSITAAIMFRFTNRDAIGSAVFQLVPRDDQWIPAARLIELTVDDASLGDLVLAPSPSANTAVETIPKSG